MLFISPCLQQGLHFTSTTQDTSPVTPQLYSYHHNFSDVSSDISPPPLYFTCITDAISIPTPLRCHHNPFCITIVPVSITIWIIFCIYHKLTPYASLSIIISPPWSTLSHIFCPHCCSYNYDVSFSSRLFCSTAVSEIYVLQCMYPFSCTFEIFLWL